jgi:benzoate transport
MDIREAIHSQPMRPFQLTIVGVCILLAMIDGYEVVSMPFTMPYLAKAWGLTPVEVGYLLGSGIFGMAFGSGIVAMLADRIGRRRHILLCLAMITGGMVLSAMAQTVTQLVAIRAFAGVFIGAIIPPLNIMVAEYSSEKRRGTVMGVYGIGFPLGSALAGFVIVELVGSFGWRAPFIFGGVLTAAMLLIVYALLPESIDYLVEKRPAGALATYNRIGHRLGAAPANALPEAQSHLSSTRPWKKIFQGVTGWRTACLWACFAGLMPAFYFANTWTAKLIADTSGDPGLGIRAGMLIQAGGVLGALLFAGVALKLRPRLVAVLMLAAGGMVFALYATQIGNISTALMLAVFVGIFSNGSLAGIYAISPSVYPTLVRSTGVGFAVGIGRIIAILGPIGTGYLLAAGWRRDFSTSSSVSSSSSRPSPPFCSTAAIAG